MKTIYTGLLSLLSLLAFAQEQNHPTCDGSRYLTDVFTEVDSTLDISYGIGVTIGGNEQELFMDIFEPVGDSATERPVVIFAFGGSFIGGVKEDVHFLCKAYAKKGFVAVTIDYTLYDLPLFPVPTEEEMKIVVTKSVADMKGAVRFLRADAAAGNSFGIDTDYIFVGGVSAGAIAAMHTAVLDDTDNLPQDLIDIIAAEGGLEGTVNDLDFSSEVQGVVNFSGGLNDSKWIDANDPPFISIHDDGDMTVPYFGGYANVFGIDIIYMEGSGTCAEVADSVGVHNYLRTLENSNGHVSYFLNVEQEKEMIDLSAAFLHDLLCAEDVLNGSEIINEHPVVIYPNPSEGILNIDHNLDASYSVSMYDHTGIKLLQTPLTNQIDISDLSSGFYVIQFHSKNGKKTLAKKLLKY